MISTRRGCRPAQVPVGPRSPHPRCRDTSGARRRTGRRNRASARGRTADRRGRTKSSRPSRPATSPQAAGCSYRPERRSCGSAPPPAAGWRSTPAVAAARSYSPQSGGSRPNASSAIQCWPTFPTACRTSTVFWQRRPVQEGWCSSVRWCSPPDRSGCCSHRGRRSGGSSPPPYRPAVPETGTAPAPPRGPP